MFYLHDFVSEYVMFPPQSPSGSIIMSTWSEDGLDFDVYDFVLVKNGKDETVLIITEVTVNHSLSFLKVVIVTRSSCNLLLYFDHHRDHETVQIIKEKIIYVFLAKLGFQDCVPLFHFSILLNFGGFKNVSKIQ